MTELQLLEVMEWVGLGLSVLGGVGVPALATRLFTANKILRAVIAGVEAYAAEEKPLQNATVKDLISRQATSDGVWEGLHAQVQKVTDKNGR